MAKEIVLEVNVEAGASIQEVKSLKDQFTEAEDAVFRLAGAGKQNTDEFRKAQLQAAKLKERVDDINESLDDLKPEAKLGAFTRVAGGLASGFTAATGAAALFGAESEDLQKQLVKVQAAMAFSEGLRGLGDLADGFKTLKAVILANPLFLIVGVVTAIGTALFALRNKISFVGDAFDALGNTLGFVVDKIKEFTDWLGISDFKAEEVKDNQLKRNQELMDSNEELYTQQIRNAKRAGEATDEIEKERLQKRNENLVKILSLLDLEDKEEAERHKKLTAELVENANKILDINAKQIKDLEDARKKASDKRIADAKTEADRLLAIEEKLAADKIAATQTLQEQLEQLEFAAIDNDIERSLEAERIKLHELQLLRNQAAIDDDIAEQAFQDAKTLIIDAGEKERAEIVKARNAEIKDEGEEEVVDTKEKELAKIEATRNGVNQAAALTGALFTLKLSTVKKGSKEEEKILKKQFQVNKAFQIAQTVITGAQAAVVALTAKNPAVMVARLALAAVTTAASVATIASTKFQSTGGGGVSAPVSAPSIPSFSAPTGGAPQGVPVNRTGETILQGDGSVVTDKSQQAASRVFVVESDITRTQGRVAEIEESATLG